ncbi:hypothetical protein KI387_006317, partial [Taxus chinensis]
RMLPQIRDSPTRYFYQIRLSDSVTVTSRPDEIYYRVSLLKPCLFFDVVHGRGPLGGGSVSDQNIHEA